MREIAGFYAPPFPLPTAVLPVDQEARVKADWLRFEWLVDPYLWRHLEHLTKVWMPPLATPNVATRDEPSSTWKGWPEEFAGLVRRDPLEDVHATAHGFDRVAGLHEGRPHLPTPTVELAAGTGKPTRHSVERGADVVAVQPMAGMYDLLRRQLPTVEVLDGRGEALPLADGTVERSP